MRRRARTDQLRRGQGLLSSQEDVHSEAGELIDCLLLGVVMLNVDNYDRPAVLVLAGQEVALSARDLALHTLLHPCN